MEFTGSFNGILILLILVLAFIKSTKDAKKKQQAESGSTPSVGRELKDIFKEIMESHKTEQKPVMPPVKPPKPSHTMTSRPLKAEPMGAEFVSSLSLVTDFEKESSLKGYKEPDKMTRKVEDSTIIKEPHPIVEDLMGENRDDEFRKAIIYSEILTRKY